MVQMYFKTVAQDRTLNDLSEHALDHIRFKVLTAINLMLTTLSWTFSVFRILSPTKPVSRTSSTKKLVSAVMHSFN